MGLKLLVNRQLYVIGKHRLKCGRGFVANSPPGGAIGLVGGGAAVKVTITERRRKESVDLPHAPNQQIDRSVVPSWRITVQNPDL